MKIWVLSDNRGYFLENEEQLAKNFCDVYGGTYEAAEMFNPDEAE